MLGTILSKFHFESAKMRFYVEYYVVKAFLLLTRLLPKCAVYALCKGIVALFFYLNKRRRLLTLNNIHLAYPNMTDKEVVTLAKQAYQNVAIMLAEIFLIYYDRLDIDTLIINKEEAVERFHRYFSGHDVGKLCITAHFSNWELLALFSAKSGYPIKTIARDGDNPLIDERIVKVFRGKYGNKIISKQNAIISLVKTIKEGSVGAILFDQKPKRNNSIETSFFGHPVRTINVIAQLKLKYNPRIIPIFIARQPNGQYEVIIKDPIEYVAPEESDHELKIMRITQHYNDILEAMIRCYPEQWFWMHDRWKMPKKSSNKEEK